MRKNIWLILTVLVAVFFLLVSYLPNLYEASVTGLLPQDRIMLWGEHIYTYDYNVYLSKIRQGAEGRWLVVDKYDNHPEQSGVMLQMLYLLAGKIAGIAGFPPALTFHLLRTLLSFLWLMTIIYLNLVFLKKPKRVFFGVLLSLLASSWPVLYRYNNEWWAGYHMSWWTEMDALKRISYLPHYTLNYIIISLLSLLLVFPEGRFKLFNSGFKLLGKLRLNVPNYALICLLIFISFFIHPASGILFFFSWFLFNLILIIWDYRSYFVQIRTYFFYSLSFLLSAALPLIYIQHVTSSYPWKSLVDFDKNSRFPLDVKEYIFALGPVVITGILGAILVLIRKDKKFLSLVTWFSGALLAIYLFKLFPFQSELRFVQTANHIPLALLTIYFLGWFMDTLPGIFSRLVALVSVTIIVILGLIQVNFSVRAQTDFIHQRAVAVQPLVPYPPQVMYPLKDFWNALVWLETNSNRNDIVLSEVTAGNYIPAYSGNFVYLGHNPETPHYDARLNQVDTFFAGKLNRDAAQAFLNSEQIKYIFFGPQEKDKGNLNLNGYSFLHPVFKSSLVTLYRVF